MNPRKPMPPGYIRCQRCGKAVRTKYALKLGKHWYGPQCYWRERDKNRFGSRGNG